MTDDKWVGGQVLNVPDPSKAVNRRAVILFYLMKFLPVFDEGKGGRLKKADKVEAWEDKNGTKRKRSVRQ